MPAAASCAVGVHLLPLNKNAILFSLADFVDHFAMMAHSEKKAVVFNRVGVRE
jgi:hypothetical protein